MKIIDFHAHIFPDDLAPKAVAALEAAGDEKAVLDGTANGLLVSMKKNEIDYAVVQPVATKPAQVKNINEWAASLKLPLIGFGALHPDQTPAEIRSEAARLNSLGLQGLKLHPEYQNFFPDEPRAFPIYEAALERDLIVFFHAGRDIAYKDVHGTPEHFANLLKIFPKLKIVLAHLGSFLMWDEVERHLVGQNAYFDLAYTLNFIPPEQLKRIIKNHGVEKIIFGTDSPWDDQKKVMEQVRALDFSPKDLEKIFWSNAAGLLKLQ